MANSKNKFYQAKKEIKGQTYTAQFNGLSTALKMVDENYLPDSRNLSSEGLTEYILKNIIVDPPGLTVDSFDDMDTLNAVAKFGQEVAQGKFRDQQNESTK